MKDESIDIIKNTLATSIVAFIGTQTEVLNPFLISVASGITSISLDLASNAIKKINMRQIEKVKEFQVEFLKQIDKNYQDKKILDPQCFIKKEGYETFEDVVEQILLKVKEEHERKKIKYYGKLLSNITYQKGINKDEIFRIIEIFKQLSYKQLCLLSLFQKSDSKKWDKNNISDTNDFNDISKTINYRLLLLEFRELLDEIPLLYSQKYRPALGMNNNIFSKGTILSDINLNQLGSLIFNLSCIGEIDDSEKEKIIDIKELNNLFSR